MKKIFNQSFFNSISFLLSFIFFCFFVGYFGEFHEENMMYNCYSFTYPGAITGFFLLITAVIPILLFLGKNSKLPYFQVVFDFIDKYIILLSGSYFILLGISFGGYFYLYNLLKWKPVEIGLFCLLALSAIYWLFLKMKSGKTLLLPYWSKYLLFGMKNWHFDLILTAFALIFMGLIKKYIYLNISCNADPNSQMAQALLWQSGQWFIHNPFTYKEMVYIVNSVRGERVFSQFPPGYISIMYLLNKVHLMDYTGVITGSLALPAIRVLGDRIFKAPVGRVAAILLLASPFFVIMSVESMNHSLGLLLFILICILISKNMESFSPVYSILAGFCIAYLGITRPLNGIIFSLFYGVTGIWYRRKNWLFIKDGFFVFLGALPVILFFLFVNYQALGKYFFLGYQLSNPDLHRLGFDFTGVAGYSMVDALKNLTLNILSISQWIFFWPMMSFLPLLLWWLFVRKSKEQVGLILLVMIQIFAYACYQFHDLYFGPRFWYEFLPVLIIFTAAPLVMFGKKYVNLFSAKTRPYISLILMVYASLFLGFSMLHGNHIRLQKYHSVIRRGANVRTLVRSAQLPEKSVILFGLFYKDWMWVYGPSFKDSIYATQYDPDFDYQKFLDDYPDWHLYCIRSPFKIEKFVPGETIMQ